MQSLNLDKYALNYILRMVSKKCPLLNLKLYLVEDIFIYTKF